MPPARPLRRVPFRLSHHNARHRRALPRTYAPVPPPPSAAHPCAHPAPQKYLWARWRRLGRSSTAWIVLTALVALLSTTPSDFGTPALPAPCSSPRVLTPLVASLPDWPILATIPATLGLVLFCIAPILYLRAKTLHRASSLSFPRKHIYPPPSDAPPMQSPAAPSTRTYLSLITRTINDPHAGRITLWYLWASLVTTAILTHLWTWRHESHDESRTLDLSLFKPTARHPYHLNERVLYLYLGNACFALWLAHKDIFDGAWGKERWPADNVRSPLSPNLHKFVSSRG